MAHLILLNEVFTTTVPFTKIVKDIRKAPKSWVPGILRDCENKIYNVSRMSSN